MLHRTTSHSLLTWFFLLLSISSFAQPTSVAVSILIPPPYSPYLQDYLQYENKMVIQLQNLTNQTLSVKLIGSIEGDNGILLQTNASYSPASPITIQPNAFFRIPASIRSRGFFDPDNLDFTGPDNLKTQILKDGILPEGNYTICLQALDYQTDAPLSDEAPAGCTLLPISYPTPPQLFSPECENNLEDRLPLFQWSLPGGRTGTAAIQYDLYVIEWLSGANPQDLVQLAVDYNAGNAIIRRNLILPTYQYQISDPGLREGTTYLWVVKARDRMGRTTFENDGLSEICSFTYRSGASNNGGVLVNLSGPKEYDIQQVRTTISGQMKYKFPGGGIGTVGMQHRNAQIETEELPFQAGQNINGELGILNEEVYALANHNYFNAFPVPVVGSQPLKNINIKLVESWAILDCDVTYLPQNRTEHKDFFILPNDYRTPGAFDGGTTMGVVIDGVTNVPVDENPLALGTSGMGGVAYSRTLAVDRTDNSGNYTFRFPQSGPGLMLVNYPGSATVQIQCEPVEVPVEGNDFVHPMDVVSNPSEIYFDQPAPFAISGNPVSNQPVSFPDQAVPRSGYIDIAPGQLPYESIEINGGRLVKILRLEIASPFYYSPDLIFWTQPGDTMALPDQVSYVKSFDLDLTLRGGRWEHQQNYQSFIEGDPIPGVDVVFSRLKDGLPAEIPMEEGQGLRDFEGEAYGNWQAANPYAPQMESTGYEMNENYDSVSVLQSDADGRMKYNRLVASHPYYLTGSAPEQDGINYGVPLQSRTYQIFSPGYCEFNLETNLNSFCQHQPIHIRDTITAYPRIPKVFGRVVTSTNNEVVPLANVMVKLKRFENGVVKQTRTEYSNEHGLFMFDNVPVNPEGNQDYAWRIFFDKAGYQDVVLPDDHDNNPNDDYRLLRPGQQWDVNDVNMDPLGQLTGYIRDEDGQLIQALVRLSNGPHIQTQLVSNPVGIPEYCGDINNLGDAINESTQLQGFMQIGEMNVMQMNATQAARFNLPAQSGDHLPLIIIPLPEQYFQDTCYVDVGELPNGQFQALGFITVKEKLHRISITVKKPDGTAAQARVYIDDRVRETNDLGFTAFRFASPETNYRVRIEPELPTLVPVDTIMSIPISKNYLQHTFQLREGKKIKVRVIVDYSGQQNQPAQPIPIAGAVVQTLLTSSPNGNTYIECITGADGICTLEGVPASPSTVEISVWKEDDEKLYIGKTVSASVNRPLNPPLDIALKTMGGVTIPDIWGFPTAITGMEIKQTNGGRPDTLFEGILTALPANPRFKMAEDEVHIPYPKIKFAATGQRDDSGRKILQPATTTGVTLHQNTVSTLLFDEFNVTLSPKRNQNYADLPFLYLQKTEGYHGKIMGVVETELSSFNFSYSYTGKFYLGKTPTEYNLDVFQTGMNTYDIYAPGQVQLAGQDPEPGPNDFYLMDIGPQNKPRSHTYSVYQFEATSDSSRSFVTPQAFYIHTILHTDIPHVTPGDLELSVGKIVITRENIQSLDNGFRKLDFKMGTYWKFYSTTPYRYDHDLGGITASNGFINTGQIDVPVRDIIIKPDKLIMNQIDEIDQLTLAGIKDIPIEEGVNIALSKGIQNIGWRLSVQMRDENSNIIADAVVAKLTGLPAPLKPQEVISIYSIDLDSESKDIELDLSGDTRPHDICDFKVQGISTGSDYFILEGRAELGREDVRVPNLPPSTMQILYKGPKNALQGKITSEYAGNLRTAGDVGFVFDFSDVSTTRQYYAERKYITTGVFTVSDKSGAYHFQLKGILELDYNAVRIHVITDDLQIANVEYLKVDQPIELGEDGKQILVRTGIQHATNNTWQPLTFDANMVGFTGVKTNQPPMTFVVDGPVSATDAELSVDGIDLGFAQIDITYNFQHQSFTGEMDVDFSPGRVSLGPVSVKSISADILIDPNGFLFAASIYGYALELFDASFGLLLGAHTAIPPGFISTVMQNAENQTLPPAIADGSIAGFFITGNVYLLNEEMPEVDFGLFAINGSVKVGIDARFYMDFEQGGASFGFGALVFADAMASVTIYGTCPDPTISLAASIQLLLEGVVEQSGGDWIVEGRGCGSLSFSISLCGIGDEVGGYAELIISSADGVSGNAGFGEDCTGSN